MHYLNKISLTFLVILLGVAVGACGDDDDGGGGGSGGGDTPSAPTVTFTTPAADATGVAINTRIYARFSEKMDPDSIDAEAFLLTGPGTTPVPGSISFHSESDVVDFLPAASLSTGVEYTATVTTNVESETGIAMEADYSWSFTTGTVADTTPPTVSYTSPQDGAVAVPVNMTLTAVFSEAMDAATLNDTTFTLMQGTSPITGTVVSTGTTATFEPGADLLPSTSYTATITTGAEDASNNPLAADHVWDFTTDVAGDTTAPTVSMTVPDTDELDVALNSSIVAVFSESMDTTTLTTSTFTLMQGTTSVVGVVTSPGASATFNPNADLAPNTVYTATITVGAEDASGNALASAYTWDFTSGSAPDTTPPTVSFTNPDSSATNVRLARGISAIFDEPMEAASLTTATFTLMAGATSVGGTVSTDATSATFNATADLLPNTVYTATVLGGSAGAKDLAGNELTADYVWTFTTTDDVTAPSVENTIPADMEVDVYENRRVVAYFDEVMDSSTLTDTTFTLDGAGAITGTVDYDDTNNSAVFLASSPLANSTVFTATITTAVTDAVGNPLVADYVWTFTTGALEDVVAPTVTHMLPANGAVNVPLNARVTAVFSEPMNGLTLTTTSFTLVNATQESGEVVSPLPATSATLIPGDDLQPNTIYTATVTDTAADLAGNTLASQVQWTFTTGTQTMVQQQPVNLQSAADFAILASSTVTNTGNSIVIGDVGISTGTSVTGWNTVTHTGSIYVDPSPIAQQAKLDLTTAYNDAAGRSVDNISLPGNLGGLTLTPGLYTNASTSGISGTGANAILTLDAQGDENAVWIFQIGSTFTCDPGTSVVLSGGAKAENIFWQVGTSATLDTTVDFKGNILAEASVSFENGASLEGRALGRNGGVTLIGNVVTIPAP